MPTIWDSKITLSEEAHETLVELAAAYGGQGMPRLSELEAAALTVGHPKTDDVVLRTKNGTPLLAVSRRLVDRLGGQTELVVGLSETGEPSFRLVRRSIAN